MGGGPVIRSLAAAVTVGASELGQKKPFQDMGNDNPTGDLTGGPLRFIPGAAGVVPALEGAKDAVTPKMPEAQATPESPLAQAQPLGDTKAVKSRNKRSFSTILTSPLGVQGQASINRPSLLGAGLSKSFLGN